MSRWNEYEGRGDIGRWMADTHLRAIKKQTQQKKVRVKNMPKQTYQIKDLKDILEHLELLGQNEVSYLQVKRILRYLDEQKEVRI